MDFVGDVGAQIAIIEGTRKTACSSWILTFKISGKLVSHFCFVNPTVRTPTRRVSTCASHVTGLSKNLYLEIRFPFLI
jgi:hypothetical protein